jgi:hypothetical protein
MIIKKIYLIDMKKLFLLLFVLLLAQEVHSININSLNFGYVDKSEAKNVYNSSPVISQIGSDFDYNSFSQSDEPSDLDILTNLGEENNNSHFDENINRSLNLNSDSISETDPISKNNDKHERKINEIQNNNDKSKTDIEAKIEFNKNIDFKNSNSNIENLNVDDLKINSNQKNIETNQSNDLLNKDLLNEKLELPEIKVQSLSDEKNKLNETKDNQSKFNDVKSNVENSNDISLDMEKKNVEKELSPEDKTDKTTSNSEVKNNIDDLSNLNIETPSDVQKQDIEKKIEKENVIKSEEKSSSVTDKIKSLFEKKDEVKDISKEIASDSIASSLVKVIDNTNKIIKTDDTSNVKKTNIISKKPYAKKIVKKKRIDHEENFCDEPHIISLSEADAREREQTLEKETFDANYDSEYENKIYEYNKKKISAAKKYKLHDYKIKVQIPEFLKVSENTLGNGHLNQIYYYKDYVNALFNAVLDEDLSAIDSLLRAIKNIDIQNSNGETLLTYAAKNKKVKSIRYLLMRGCNSKISNDKGETIEGILRKNNDRQIISLLKQS